MAIKLKELSLEEDQKSPIEVPYEKLSLEALDGLLADFIMREGTDYGWVELDHATKIARLKRQLENGDVKVTFDPSTETINLVTLKQWQKLITEFQA